MLQSFTNNFMIFFLVSKNSSKRHLVYKTVKKFNITYKVVFVRMSLKDVHRHDLGLSNVMNDPQMILDVQRSRMLKARAKAARVPFEAMSFQVVYQGCHMFRLLLAVKTT